MITVLIVLLIRIAIIKKQICISLIFVRRINMPIQTDFYEETYLNWPFVPN